MTKEKDLKVEHAYYNKYQYIAVREYNNALRYKSDIKALQDKGTAFSDEDSFATAKMNAQIEICGVQVIIFCTLAVESYINHYATKRLTKEYLEKYLDQLDLMTKWIVIPRMVTGKQLDPESEAVKNLNALILTRDRLLQSKPKQKFSDRFSSIDIFWIEDAEFAIATVAVLLKALSEIDDSIKPDWATKPNPCK